jgi:hypothetical protein
MSLRYGGDPFDPTAGEDNLSARVIRGVASDIRYSRDEQGNCLTIAL